MGTDFSRLQSLLEKEKYPLEYTLKLIGRDSNPFRDGIAAFEGAYPNIGQATRRSTVDTRHVALTYRFTAVSAQELVSMYQAVERIPDLVVML